MTVHEGQEFATGSKNAVMRIWVMNPKLSHWCRLLPIRDTGRTVGSGRRTTLHFSMTRVSGLLVDGKDGGKGAPMACAMVYWGSRYKRFEEIFLRYGAVVPLSHFFYRKIGIMRPPAKFAIKPVHPSQLERFRRDRAITPLITEHGLHHQAGQGT